MKKLILSIIMLSAFFVLSPMEVNAVKPGVPTNVKAEITGTNEVTLTWDPPAEDVGGLPTTQYSLRYDGYSTGIDAKVRSFTFKNLEQGVLYNFSVGAYNNSEYGDRVYVPLTIPTGTAVKPGVPTNVRARTTGYGEITILWEAPKSDGGSPIINYYLSEGGHTGKLKSTVFQYKQTGLKDDTEYTFKLVARNAVGGSDPVEVTIKTFAREKEYKITINNGTTEYSSAAEGDHVIIKANVAPAGKVFDKWVSSDVDFYDAYLEMSAFKMPGKAVNITATYKALPSSEYAINIQSDSNGTISASKKSAKSGDSISLIATPNVGYKFKKWEVVSGGVKITDNKFTMPSKTVTVKAIFEKLPEGATEVAYTIIKGANSSWKTGMMSEISMTCDGDIANFTGINVDGVLLDSADYSVVSGSTIVSFNIEYLETLTEGVHTVDFIYNNGCARGEITKLSIDDPTPIIEDEEEPTEKEKEFNIVPVVIGGVVLVGLAGTFIVVKKRKKTNKNEQ